MTLDELKKRDHDKYYLEVPEEGFSPTKNKQVIENSIKKYEAMRRKQVEKLRDPYAERADAVVSYLRASDRVGGGKKINEYFSPSMLAYLRGVEIREKLMAGMTLIGKQGHGIKRRF